jgi:hypothetical protein
VNDISGRAPQPALATVARGVVGDAATEVSTPPLCFRCTRTSGALTWRADTK